MAEPIGDDAGFVEALPAGFDALVRGAIDLHVHGQPDLSRDLAQRGPDAAVVRLARRYGVRGWVLKSHLWPTMDRAAALQEQHDPADFLVLGSITLNPPAGGVHPAPVQLASAHGARVVFLPTWGAAADVERGGYVSRLLARSATAFAGYQAADPIRVIDDSGRPTGAVRDVLDACADLGLLLATGHVSLDESLAIAELAGGRGQPLLVTHPLHDAVGRPGMLGALADTGAILEFSGAPLLHPDARLTVAQVADAIAEVGAGRAALSSDVFSRWVPPEPETLRMFAEQLRYLGCTAEELRTMLVENPRSLLVRAGVEALA
jgi:Family of unknown function (DUF6282)